ncbi:hypothetical protein [Methanococcoides methylutens]|nr:hypothetical protein [Methanococcoides methylutens]
MSYVEKTCSVCGNKFIVSGKIADRELFCTLGCFSRAMKDEPQSTVLEA